MRVKRIGILLLLLGMAVALTACSLLSGGLQQTGGEENRARAEKQAISAGTVEEGGEYTTKDQVASFIHTYHKLPRNYISQNEAMERGWSRSECPADYGFMIGGRRFGNREGHLPKDRYYECDVDYDGHARGVNRLVYTKEGTVYYTGDHYNSFEKLY